MTSFHILATDTGLSSATGCGGGSMGSGLCIGSEESEPEPQALSVSALVP